jgi:hyaluronate lyase
MRSSRQSQGWFAWLGPSFRWFVLGGLLLFGCSRLPADEFDDLRLKWRDILTGGTNLNLADPVVQSRLAGVASTANSYWSTLNTAPGRTNLWADAARPDQSEDITTCYNRLRAMALAWATRGCSLETNAALGADIVGGLDWLYTNYYNETRSQYDNWWDWQIGTPQHLNNAAVLVYDLLTPAQITNYNKAVDKFTASPNGTGANRTDTALVVAVRGILGRSAAKLASARDGLSPVFPYVTSGDGFYTDGSFIQHTRHPYTGSYGSVLMDGLSKLMWLLAGSTWQVTDPASSNVFRWVYDSYEPVIYKGATMDNLRGRAISRLGSTDHAAGAGNMASILQLAQFAPTNDALAFKRMLKYWIQADTYRSFTNNVPLNLMAATRALMADTNIVPRGELVGHYRFPSMDRVAHLRPGFGFALSLSSSRIYTYECINQENLKGWFTGDGMTTLYNDDLGQFSGNYWPTIDPYHLPGTTVDQTPRVDGSGQSATTGQNWVGGVGLADFGVAGMALDAQASSLVAKKSWFLFDNEIVCLGAGITCGSASAVHTTVENRKLGATATNVFTVGGVNQPTTPGWSSNLTGVTWTSLAGAGGYYFPGTASLAAVRETRTNSWSAINQGYSTNPVTESFLTFWFNHGSKPTNATYAYAVLPNLSASQTAAYAATPDIQVIENSANIQAVRETTLGLTAVNFWNTGTNTADFITANGRAAVIVRETNEVIEIALSDPTQTNTGTLVVTLNRAATWPISADAGVTVQQLSPQVRLAFAVNGARGKSFRAVLSTNLRNPNPTWDANPGATNAQDGGGLWNNTATNWWDGVGNVAWNDALSPMATFGNGGMAGTVTVVGAHASSSLVFAPVAGGSYTLMGNEPLTLGTGLTADASATLDVPLTLAADQLWNVSAGNTLAVTKSIAASSPVTLSLAGGGVVRLAGAAGQLAAGLGRLNFNGNVTLDMAGKSETVAQLGLENGVTATVTGSGSLAVTGATNLGIGGTTTGAAETLDLSGLAAFAFTAPANTFSVGGQANTVAGTGTLRLATNSVITAATFAVQSVTGSTSTQSRGTLFLGQATTLNADTAAVGLVRDNGTIQFAPGAANPTLAIRASDGVGRAAEWRIGARSSSFFTTNTALVDLVSGVTGGSTLDARLGTLKVADETYNLTTTASLNGTFVMGGGVLDVTNLLLGLKSSLTTQSLGIVNATFVQTNGGTVVVDTLTLADLVPGNTGTINATYHLAGGTLRARAVQPGAGGANRNFNWLDGTIRNYDAGTDLTITLPVLNLIPGGLHQFDVDVGHFAIVSAGLAGAGSLTKAGAGALVLAGTNTHSGGTTVSAGALRVNGVVGGPVTVAAGARLEGAGQVLGPVFINPGGVLDPGELLGPLTIGGDLVLAGDLNIDLDKTASPSNDVVTVSGVLTNAGVGTLIATNRGSLALAVGDRFPIFNQPLLNGGALTISSGGGVIWSNRLALDGSIQVAAVVNPAPTTLQAGVSGGAMSLAWPADHTGWRLEVQTNTLGAGLGTNWFTWPGSAATNAVSVPLGPAAPAVFFRLVYP